jgi:hypothetical protein
MTDQELDSVLIATRTIPPERRAEFLAAIGYALSHSCDAGAGVERAIVRTRRDLLNPPHLATIILR